MKKMREEGRKKERYQEKSTRGTTNLEAKLVRRENSKEKTRKQ